MGAVLSPLLNAADSTTRGEDYIPSESDVFATRDILNSRLPLELVDTVLDLAKYWPCISAMCSLSFDLSAPAGQEIAFCCFITPGIPCASRLIKTRNQVEDQVELEDFEVDVRRRVKRVVFEISSRDQGWGGEPGLTLPYAGSWTWFDAEIWHPNGVPEPTGHSFYESISSTITESAQIKPEMTSPTDEELAAAGYHRVKPPSSCADIQANNSWLIQRNRRASSRVRTHVVGWSDRDFVHHECHPEYGSDSSASSTSDSDSDTPAQGTSAPTRATLPDLYGCGNGADFVRSLQVGDRIAVVARAKYPGWENQLHGNLKAKILYTII